MCDKNRHCCFKTLLPKEMALLQEYSVFQANSSQLLPLVLERHFTIQDAGLACQ